MPEAHLQDACAKFRDGAGLAGEQRMAHHLVRGLGLRQVRGQMPRRLQPGTVSPRMNVVDKSGAPIANADVSMPADKSTLSELSLDSRLRESSYTFPVMD